MGEPKDKSLYDNHGNLKFDNTSSENPDKNKYMEFDNSGLDEDKGSKYQEFERDWD